MTVHFCDQFFLFISILFLLYVYNTYSTYIELAHLKFSIIHQMIAQYIIRTLFKYLYNHNIALYMNWCNRDWAKWAKMWLMLKQVHLLVWYSNLYKAITTYHCTYFIYLHEIIYTGYNVFTIKAFVLGTIYTCIKKNYIVCC